MQQGHLASEGGGSSKSCSGSAAKRILKAIQLCAATDARAYIVLGLLVAARLEHVATHLARTTCEAAALGLSVLL